MLNTAKYIFDEDLFDPLSYRNPSFKKICQIAQGPQSQPSITRTLYLDPLGKIYKIERPNGVWTAYSPDSEPPIPSLNVVDQILYNKSGKIKTLTTRLLDEPKKEIARTEYTYNRGQLLRIEKNHIKNKIMHLNVANFHFVSSKVQNIGVKAFQNKVLKHQSSKSFHWNKKGRVDEKNEHSIFFQDKKVIWSKLSSTKYVYNPQGQLETAQTHSQIGSEESESSVRFQYLHPRSDLITKVQNFSGGILIRQIDYLLGNKMELKRMRIATPENRDSIVKYIYYK